VRSTLRELERLRAPGWPYFLRSFMRESRVNKPSAFNAPRRVASNCNQGAGDAMPHRAGLAVRPAAADVDARVELFRRAGDGQRLRRGHPLRFEREIIFKLAPLTVILPLPDASRTRAMAVLRRPVRGIREFGFSHLSVEGCGLRVDGFGKSGRGFERFGLLGGVRMFRALENFPAWSATGCRAGFSGIMPLTACRMSFSGCLARNWARWCISRRPSSRNSSCRPWRFLLAGEPDLFGVDDNDKIAGVEVGREDGLVFARKMSATCTASRPSTAPSASITCHFPLVPKFTLAIVFI